MLFEIPVLGGIEITETVVNTWIVMAVIVGLCLFLTSGMQVRCKTRRQVVAEFIVKKVNAMVGENMGEHFLQVGYAPLIATIMGLSALCSLSGMVGMFAPTSDLSTLLAWSLVVFVLITYNKFRAGGPVGYIKGYFQPIPVLLPFNIISEVATFRASQLADPDAVDELLKARPEDKWRKKSNPNLKERRALSHLDVRVVGILTACTVKTPRPRPDGSVGQKWAILQVDDGAAIDAFCFAKAWETCSSLESAVDRLVVLCGEVTHRVNYEKDDKMEKRRPSVGDLNFTVREAYLLEDALPLLSDGMHIRLSQSDPEILSKVARVREVAGGSPGRLPVVIDLACPGGKTARVSLGDGCRVAVTVAFLSELEKILPQSDVSFHPSDKVYLAPREPRPWES